MRDKTGENPVGRAGFADRPCCRDQMTNGRAFTLDIQSQLAFYGAYHSNRYNQLIHFVFVPVILFSIAVWLAYTPAVTSFSFSAGYPYATLNGAFFLLFLPYSLFYALLDPVAGVSWSCCIGLPVWLGAEALRQAHPDDAWRWAVYAHVLGWFMQIVPGHGYFERRKPALLDSFVQSLLLAPLFVWFELLFVFGYRRDLYDAVQDDVRRRTAEGGMGRGLLEDD